MVKKRYGEGMKKPELLAPAGDLARAKTAILYGADAIFLGGQNFSLRSRASNFSLEDIQEACVFAKEHGSRVHVTVNVIPHEEDFDGLKEYLKRLEDFGVTAIIVASPAIMRIAKEVAPKLELHCSTQMSITNVETAKFLVNEFHLDRVVLARECSIEEVRAITKECPVEVEAFIHGGMCVNYSGRCTLSNRMTLRDANRGGCAQSCRWEYKLFDGDEELSQRQLFTMSSKDLMAAEYIHDLMAANVSSFKIEGRMKTEYYVANVVRAYRELIDAICLKQAPLTKEEMAVHLKEIARVENRETASGLYSGENDIETILYHPTTNHDVNHDFISTIMEYKNGTAKMQVRNAFCLGETLEVLSPGMPKRSFVVSHIQNIDGEVMERAKRPMEIVEIPVPFALKKDDIIRRGRV
ncbi:MULTISPECIES: U32 family peptidase [Terrabacteria group]|uniref:peptidase U32 family protein n=1 Tax=Bacillati TaxID=1783272 RepID=UPI001C6F58F5|nr:MULTISPECIES: U32 family peptidase [Terrabacteria group]MBW9212249.1 U32 family peptidase [Trueperella sp. zg.1013]